MNQSVPAVRLHCFLFGLIVLARALGASAVLTYALTVLNDGPLNPLQAPTPFLFWLILAALPALILAPIIGGAASSPGSRNPVFILSTGYGLIFIVACTIEKGPWPSCLAMLALETGFFAAAQLAMTSDLSQQAQISIPRLQTALFIALAAGNALGIWATGQTMSEVKSGMPVPCQIGIAAYGAAFLMSLFLRFPAGAGLSLKGGMVQPFARSVREIIADPRTRTAFFGLLWAFGIGLIATQWLLSADARLDVAVGFVLGAILGGINGHPFRCLGLVPYACLGVVGCCIWGLDSGSWDHPAFCLAIMVGVTFVPLLSMYQIYQSPQTRGHGAALLFAGCALVAVAFAVFIYFGFLNNTQGSVKPLGYGLVIVGSLGAILFWRSFLRQAIEATAELLFLPLYRISVIGPGVTELPLRGPVIVFANHAAWFDPLWLAKVVPFPMTPMMTSKFYDLWFLRWLMRKVFVAIRVPDVAMRRDTPEIKLAIEALDESKRLFIFPEGWLRRKENQELRRFGRGIWKILQARPDTPTFACWIEGGWGSMISYRGGPPCKKKRFDFLRRIRIVIGPRVHLDAAALQSHMATRKALMEAALAARAMLGLPPYDPFTFASHEDDEKNEESPEKGEHS